MKVIVSWSSGKDSAWMVHVLRARSDVHVGALLTTINRDANRVAMHASTFLLALSRQLRGGGPFE